MTLTTNGTLLGENLNELLLCGLDGVNVSLDTSKADVYRRITGSDRLDTVLESIERSVRAGLRVKINCVLEDRVNSEEWEALVNLSRNRKLDVRFIEMMPIGPGKNQKAVKGGRLLGMLREKYPGVEREISVHGNGPAVYYRIPGFCGERRVHQRGSREILRLLQPHPHDGKRGVKVLSLLQRQRGSAGGAEKRREYRGDKRKDTGGCPAKTGDALL